MSATLICKALSKMKCSKAAGPSGIIAEMLKAAGEEGYDLARQLTEVVFSCSVIPSHWRRVDCFTLLLAQHLVDVSCFIGPSMPSGICMEIHTKIMQKWKKKQSCDEGNPRQPHVYLQIDQSQQRLDQPITSLDRNILRGHQRT